MSERSYLCDPHVSIGLTAGDGGALLWPYMTSLIRAKEYIYTGERIPASWRWTWVWPIGSRPQRR